MSTMSKPTVRKGGRPSKPTDEKRTHVVTIKLNDAEYSDLLERSKTDGVKMAEYVRHGAFRLTIERHSGYPVAYILISDKGYR